MEEKKKEFPNVDYSQIPDHMQEGMREYLEYGRKPGGFLLALLANDLHFAVKWADCTNRYKLLEYTDFFLSEIPSRAWGSYENVYYWMISRQRK